MEQNSESSLDDQINSIVVGRGVKLRMGEPIGQAFYQPGLDRITVPERSQYKDSVRDGVVVYSAAAKRGRCQKFSDAAIQFCLTIKCLFGQPLRQTLGLVESLLGMAGLHWPVPDYSTVCRRQKSLDVQVRYRASDKGLHMLADSTGIKFLGEGEWKTKKHGAQRRRQWRKVHLGIDAQTLQIRAIAVTTNEVGDSPMAADLLGQIPSNEEIAIDEAQ